jgi:type I restriction enzyme, S subunit
VSSCALNSPWEFALPPGWKREQLKYNSYLKGRLGWQNLRADEYTSEGPYLVTSEHFVDDRIDWKECYHVSVDRYEMAPQIQLKRGDVLVMKDGAAMGKLAYVDELPGKACLNSHLLLLRPVNDRYHTRLLYYVLGSPMFRAYMEQERTGSTFFGLSQESISNFPFSFPAIAWQELIVSFLDGETAKIDTLIAKMQRLIEMLQEKRLALISHAVTKGLNSGVPMKESGHEWLGEIPNHWRAARIRYVACLESGHTPSRQHPEYWVDCNIPWFTLADVWQLREGSRKHVCETEEMISELGLVNSAARLLPKDTVILSRTASVGFTGILDRPMATSQDFVNWICGPRLLPEYLWYVFRGMRQEFERLMMGSTHQTVYMPQVESFTTPIPPISEQNQIVKFLDKKTESIDSVQRKADTMIGFLREYRTALISAAVTGKIDVRGEAD